jgi:LysM repeat protein
MKRTGDVLLILMVVCVLGLSPVLPSRAQAPAQAPPAPASDTYVVQKGDTLWDIARQLYSDPLYWQRIWNQNPFIVNPNRIFPGDTLALPGKGFAPATPLAEAPKPEAPKEEAKAEPAAPPKSAAPPKPAITFDLAPPPPIPVASQQALLCSPVLISDRVADTLGIGTVVDNTAHRNMMAAEDTVFMKMDPSQQAKVGDRLTVARASYRVVHPFSRRSVGRVMYAAGVIEVTGLREGVALGRVIVGCDPITLGDRLVPFSMPPFPSADQVAKPATRQLEGAIVAAYYQQQMVAQQQVVFMDVGRAQGVNPGDVFAIYRPSPPAVDAATGRAVGIPPERRGEATVLRVTDATATAVISESARDSRPGDLVVLSRQIQPQP